MNHKQKLNLIMAMMLIAAMIAASLSTAFAVTQEEYDKAQEEAKAAKEASEAKRKEAKEAAKAAAAAVENVEEAEKKLDEIYLEIEDTKVAISNKEAEIEGTKAAIADKESEIENTKSDIEAKQDEIDDQQTSLDNRLTVMYKTGNAGFIDVILNSENIGDLMANVGMVHRILESDQKLVKKLEKDYKELKQIKKDLEAQEAELVEQHSALVVQEEDLVDQQIDLEAKEAETEELKKKYQKEADELHALQKQKEAEAAEMAADAARKQAEAEKMIVESGGQVDTAPGEYLWPTKSNWELSDKYGWRICPFHGREFHNGLDIVLTSGTDGSPVYAIADGYVTRASWYGGYGNCIQYAIGNGYSVLCGHLSGYNCSEGQYVTRGSVIGYIGTTGASTGPHLHFTIFQNGETINPFSLY